MRLEEAIKAFLEDSRHLSPETLKWYEKHLRLLEPLFHKHLDEITSRDLQEIYRKFKQRDYSPYTLHGILRAWRRLFRWAVRAGLTDRYPMTLPFPRLPDEPPKAISDDDLRCLLQTARKKPRDYALILFLADTGVRLTGLLSLTWDRLDLDAGRALVTEKGRSRFVFFGEATTQALREWKRLSPKGDSRVFPLTASGVYALLRRLARQCGIRGPYNPHSFRHAVARRLLMNGGNLAQVSHILGHSTVQVTVQFYARFRIQELQEFHRKYNRLPLP